MPAPMVHVACPALSAVWPLQDTVLPDPSVIFQVTVPASGVGVTVAVSWTDCPVVGDDGEDVIAVVVGLATKSVIDLLDPWKVVTAGTAYVAVIVYGDPPEVRLDVLQVA